MVELSGERRSRFSLRLDPILLLGILLLGILGTIVLYSASGQELDIVYKQVVRIGVGLFVMTLIAQTPVHWFRETAWWLYFIALVMLVLVLIFGDIGKGAQRWLEVGPIRFQPSELMKLAMPMAIAAWFATRQLPPNTIESLIALVLVVVPMFLIVRQPDLGTALLVGSSGAIVIFFAGIGWRLLLVLLSTVAAGVPVLWHFMHDYQRRRVMTFLNPENDPLGAGYHIIQSKIALGSGGIEGKGWLNGSQSSLQFIPERTTDFVFSVYAEEFGFIGVAILVLLYLAVVLRGFYLAYTAQDTFARLLGASLGMIFFVYFFVNVGMVSGLLPVVGVPLPLVSYGGTSMVTLMAAFGMLMAIGTEKRLMPK